MQYNCVSVYDTSFRSIQASAASSLSVYSVTSIGVLAAKYEMIPVNHGFRGRHSHSSGVHSLHLLRRLSFFFPNFPTLLGSSEGPYQFDDRTYHWHLDSMGGTMLGTA